MSLIGVNGSHNATEDDSERTNRSSALTHCLTLHCVYHQTIITSHGTTLAFLFNAFIVRIDFEMHLDS